LWPRKFVRASVWKETPFHRSPGRLPRTPPGSPMCLHCCAAVASCMLHVLQVLQDGRQRLFNMPVPPFPHLALTLASQRNDRRRCKVLKSARHNLHIKGKWKKMQQLVAQIPTNAVRGTVVIRKGERSYFDIRNDNFNIYIYI